MTQVLHLLVNSQGYLFDFFPPSDNSKLHKPLSKTGANNR